MLSTGLRELNPEEIVIASILVDSDCIDELDFLEPHDFGDKQNRLAFEVIRWLHMQNKPIDIVTVSNHFADSGRKDEINVSRLISLSQAVPSSANVVYYAKMVRTNALKRMGIEAANVIADLSRDDFDSDEDYFAAIETVIDRLRPAKSSAMRGFAETRQEYFQHLESKAEKMVTGFNQFDNWASMWRGWLYVLAARPSTGKTAKALIMAVGIALQRREVDRLMRNMKDAGVVLFFSLETPASRLMDRIISNLTGISYNRIINKGYQDGFTEEEWKKINKAYDFLESLPLFIMDKPAITIEEVRSIARRYKKQYGKIAAIFIDYLQIMRIPLRRGEKRHEAIGRVTAAGKEIAQSLNCCMVMLSQLNRDSEQKQEPQLSDLKESGSIEQDADVVEFLYHDPGDEMDGGKVIQSIIAKGRDIGVNRFRYLFQGWLMRFKELEQKEVAAASGGAKKNTRRRNV